jgi:DNA (cytosine-5)-methyltransferase 1
MNKLRVLDLFSGIGGFSLGLERTGGFETVAFCEIEPFPRRVLAKHWPGVPIYDDVRTLTAERLRADGISVDVICGGFPCQDISHAGKGAGIEGERSGLWSEYARIIGELRPAYVLVENVAALLGRGLDRVLGDLAALGFDAEWHCIPASAVGAPHRRDRLWLVAYPNGWRGRSDTAGRHDANGQDAEWAKTDGLLGTVRLECRTEDVADTAGERCGETREFRYEQSAQWPSGGCKDVADPDALDAQGFVAQRNDTIIGREQVERQARLCGGAGHHQDWSIEPALGRVAHGVPDRVGQLRAYGNAVVPQIPELIGRAILEARASC